jgi:gas vesicle protein
MRWLMALALGAAATYLLDPESGEERRKQLRKSLDKARKAGRKARVQAGL